LHWLVGAVVVGLGQSAVLSSQAAGALDRTKENARTAVLWRDPGALSTRDLFWGSGAAARVPQPPFRFQEEDTSGTQPKLVVTDGGGVVWDVKFGIEARAEVAANRIVWALGYLVEEMYFITEGVIEGAGRLKRADDYVAADGRFSAARFKRRNPDMDRTGDRWSFAQNAFFGTRELSGLMILMNLINNWDIEGERNNAILAVKRSDGSVEHWYIVADLGGTFGKMGGRLDKHTKWSLSDYLVEPLVERVSGEHLDLHYDGMDASLDKVPLEHAKWFAQFAAGLREPQLRRAFEAAGASPTEIDGFSRRLAAKIGELASAVGSGSTRAR
jgi:hypothetical protein